MQIAAHQTGDQVVLVNDRDEVIGSMDKIEAHRWPAKRHRAISVFLFRQGADGQIETLIQQRSQFKIVGATLWANTVCGNVWPGESYEDCAQRRLAFELGITGANIEPVQHFFYQVQCNQEFGENEADQVFAGWFDQSVTPNPNEVMATRWVPFSEMVSLEGLAPWTKMILADQQVAHQLSVFINSMHKSNND